MGAAVVAGVFFVPLVVLSVLLLSLGFCGGGAAAVGNMLSVLLLLSLLVEAPVVSTDFSVQCLL